MKTGTIHLDKDVLPQVNDLEDEDLKNLQEAVESIIETRVDEGSWPY